MLNSKLDKLINWIRQTTDATSGRGVLVPVSGGSDSALCLWLCAQALPRERVLAAYVGENLRCRSWFEGLSSVKFLPEPPINAHIEALRWAMMLNEALAFRGWLVGTRNRTEDVLGNYSLASRLSTYLPLSGLWKSEVMELCRVVGVPEEILASSKRADPECGRPQELADIPFTTMDRFLQVKLEELPASALEPLSPSVRAYLEALYQRHRFKSELPLRAPMY